ncbi:bifunctional UDP-N-acetylglucosamine diphosphorylase/glucosamine-1-phosphate N-acetyltransferase GlmU, partial [bacterium]|nr:bifunctional UDP-N-acetylglucosamine diphosphorylase/glucosamine-1-phosphate N-acetyltransferase GlmU [bacterium]
MSSKNLFVVLAAGNSKRMMSKTSKVLHKICGKTLLEIVLGKIPDLNNSKIIIVCNECNIDEISALSSKIKNCTTILQGERLGTGHAVRVAIESLGDEVFEKICVLYGDCPLVSRDTISKIMLSSNNITFAAFENNDPQSQYGRFSFLPDGSIADIVEYKDITEEQKLVLTKCNAGTVGGRFECMKHLLSLIKNDNKAGEYYLTDIAKLSRDVNKVCKVVMCSEDEALGVNNMNDLADVEQIIQNSLRKKFMLQGVRLIDPSSVYFSFDTEIGHDVIIEPNVTFLNGVKIKNDARIKSFCYLEDVTICSNASVGPFARIRGKTIIGEGSKIGNFIEIKNSVLADGVKAGHFGYIGDGE